MNRLGARQHEWAFAVGFALLLGLLAAVAAMPGGVSGRAPGEVIDVQVQADSGRAHTPPAVDLLLPGGGAPPATARLRFDLPASVEGGARWVLWIRREPFDLLQVSAPGWNPTPRDFFRPLDDDSELPMAYVVPLPRAWQGSVVLDVEAKAGMRATLRPQVIRESAIVRINQRGLALVAMVYACLFTLSLMTLAIYAAARDRSFLAFSGFSLLGLLLLAAANGHLYMLPGLGALAAWRANGIWALSAFFMAAALQVIAQFVGTAAAQPRMKRVIDWLCLGLLGVGALCLANVGAGGQMQSVATAGWGVSSAVAILALVAAARRRVPMALPVLLLMSLALLAVLVMEAVMRGAAPDMLWSRYGYQVALVACAALIAVGLMARISEFRDQRDRDRSAREDTERLMRRETARSAFGTMLQARLRTLDGGDIPMIAFRLLLEHVLPHVPAQAAAVVAKDYHGHDALVAEPLARRAHFHGVLTERGLSLRRLATTDIPLQQAVQMDGAEAQELAVRMPVRSPGWAMLVLQRAGRDGFSPDEAALAQDFAQMTASYADQALAALQLRRTAEVDALTGAVNRRTIDQLLARHFQETERAHRPLSVLFVDLDHFKEVNDRYGHACGDECLRRVAGILRQSIGERDMLGRYGGEEFVAVLPGRDSAEARRIGESLRAAVEDCVIHWEGERIALSVSVGVATRHEQEKSAGVTLARADKALYAAKRYGRNRVQVAPALFG